VWVLGITSEDRLILTTLVRRIRGGGRAQAAAA
jgi:hypothetical protein